MIHKSYLIEDNIELLKNNLILFYGENLGLLDDFKNKINSNSKNKVLKYSQDDILKDENLIINEIKNLSLFEEEKIFFIQNANDKILNFVNKILHEIKDNKLYIFSNLLDSRSKLRSFFEKQKGVDVVPCYPDNELTIKKIISKNLKGFSGLTPVIISTIIDSCSCQRTKLYNEIKKIKSYFQNKSIDIRKLTELLNLKEDDDINLLRDSALTGNNSKTNKLLQSMIIEPEKAAYYVSMFINRFLKLKEIITIKSKNIEEVVNNMKPPIFWKDKPILIEQAKVWNDKKLYMAINKTYDTEYIIKSNSQIDKKIIIKKLIIDVCILANAA